MASEYQIAREKLEVSLAEFQQACNTDRMFEAGVRELVDILQPYRLAESGYRAQLKNN